MKLKYIIALCLLFVLVSEMAFVVKIKRDSERHPITKTDEVSPLDNTVIQTGLKSSSAATVSSVN